MSRNYPYIFVWSLFIWPLLCLASLLVSNLLALSPKSPVLYSALWCWDLDPVNHTFPLLAGFLGSASGALEGTPFPFAPYFNITQQHFCTLVVAVCFTLSLTSITSFITFPQRYQHQLTGAPFSNVWVPTLWEPSTKLLRYKHQLGSTFSSKIWVLACCMPFFQAFTCW